MQLIMLGFCHYFIDISEQAVADDGDGALDEWGTVELVLRIKHGPEEPEADQTVDVQHDRTEDRHPQQRPTCNVTTLSHISAIMIALDESTMLPLSVTALSTLLSSWFVLTMFRRWNAKK